MLIRFRRVKHWVAELRSECAALVSRYADITPDERDIISAVRPYTMTSRARLLSAIHAVRHVVRAQIPGDIMECGVWRGGSMMAMALTLIGEGDTTRRLHLADTFTGMTAPEDVDRDVKGRTAAWRLSRSGRHGRVRAVATRADVERNIRSTEYPMDQIHFIEGAVEETIPAYAPRQLALLRLDTDWYKSTKHELVHLFPRVVPGGILIIDDYGAWRGARKAVDEYFAGQRLFLHRIDETGRVLVKPHLSSTTS